MVWPLLAELCGSRAEPVRGHRALVCVSLAVLPLTLIALVLRACASDGQWDLLCRVGLYKQ